MKVKITRVVLVMEDGSKTTIKPNKIVEDVEAIKDSAIDNVLNSIRNIAPNIVIIEQ